MQQLHYQKLIHKKTWFHGKHSTNGTFKSEKMSILVFFNLLNNKLFDYHRMIFFFWNIDELQDCVFFSQYDSFSVFIYRFTYHLSKWKIVIHRNVFGVVSGDKPTTSCDYVVTANREEENFPVALFSSSNFELLSNVSCCSLF